ncbi:aminoacylase-1-like [Uranotaenia lowii]|uniref:aminoacylase-1-like n=1 Tax=Uranotaenia lowii TaxID=190385 RepID=UPI0024786573|nr:aminoacylase-1-like [Uranotaenia lowii]
MSSNVQADWESNEEIRLFREYLKIPSVHPNINYDGCVEFLKRQAASLNLPVQVIEVHPRNPIVIMTWQGTDPGAKSIILNSHMDVVPVYPDQWTHPPFSAHLDKEGRIYARGSQDMKCVGIQYLAAIRAMQSEGVKLKRTLHLLFVPDEEVGGVLGMRDFVHTKEFQALNCGFSLDEGYASEDETFVLFNGERTLKFTRFYISGSPGHGSLILQNTAGEKARKLIDRMMDFRRAEEEKLLNNPNLTVGDVTTVNLTMMSGGVQSNVIPAELMVCFDVRLSVTVDIETFTRQLETWCEESGGGIRIDLHDAPHITPTKLDETNPFWVAMKGTLDAMGLAVKSYIFPGATDSRFIRHLGIPAIGFSPINNTPKLLHDHDEFLHADIFLKGIQIYKKLIQAVANV